eukprot:3925281-Prymnesium_polylepis.2
MRGDRDRSGNAHTVTERAQRGSKGMTYARLPVGVANAYCVPSVQPRWRMSWLATSGVQQQAHAQSSMAPQHAGIRWAARTRARTNASTMAMARPHAT